MIDCAKQNYHSQTPHKMIWFLLNRMNLEPSSAAYGNYLVRVGKRGLVGSEVCK